MIKKYELTDETITRFGRTLYRIKALISFGNVDEGDKGGFVEKEENLNQEGDAWVSGNARVYGDAWVSGNAWVYGNARVYGNAEVYGDAWVSGNARVYGNAEVSGNARVSGNAEVYGDAWVSGNARVSERTEIIWINNIGSENGTLTVTRSKDGGLFLTRGCFSGDLSEFEKAVEQTHGESQYGKEYKALIEYIKLRFA